eukprot:817381_1
MQHPTNLPKNKMSTMPSRRNMKSGPPGWKSLKTLGVNEDDVHSAEILMQSNRIMLCPKVLRILGATRDEIEMETAKKLGELGISGRRRSFVGQNGRQRGYSL